jgi:hypothetical protein
MELKPGSRWKSAVCTTQVVVVRPPSQPAALECGGAAMLPLDAEDASGGSPTADTTGGTIAGKRYHDEASGIEVLGSKAGQGSLGIGGRPLALKEAKPLPSSD